MDKTYFVRSDRASRPGACPAASHLPPSFPVAGSLPGAARRAGPARKPGRRRFWSLPTVIHCRREALTGATPKAEPGPEPAGSDRAALFTKKGGRSRHTPPRKERSREWGQMRRNHRADKKNCGSGGGTGASRKAELGGGLSRFQKSAAQSAATGEQRRQSVSGGEASSGVCRVAVDRRGFSDPTPPPINNRQSVSWCPFVVLRAPSWICFFPFPWLVGLRHSLAS